MIQYFSHKQIDKSAWDNCLLNSVNGLIYGTSWYLDQLSPGWEAIVSDDYQSVMPLPVKHKWGINYLIRPAFCQQLGLFSKSAFDKNLLEEYIGKIPSQFKWINMPMNEGNFKGRSDLAKDSGVNYLLALEPSYEILRSAYVQNTKRNLGKSIDKKVNPEYSEDIKMLVKLKLEHAFSSLNQLHVSFLHNIFDRYQSSGEAKIVCVMDEDNKMIAGALFIHFRNRWIYLLSASSASGKECRAMFAIIDKFIQDHAGKDEFLDFEGSMIPELARFFAGFGAFPRSYPLLKLNRLPFPLNLFRK